MSSAVASLVDTDDDLADLMDRSIDAKKGRRRRSNGRRKKKRGIGSDESESELTSDGEPMIPVDEYWDE